MLDESELAGLTEEDVRRIALALPGAIEGTDDFAFSVENRGKHKAFLWSWKERVAPKQPRVPRDDVIAVRVVNNEDKQALLASGNEAFFTEPHYNGFPAILVRLAAVDVDDLRELITNAWRCQAPPALVKGFDSHDVS